MSIAFSAQIHWVDGVNIDETDYRYAHQSKSEGEPAVLQNKVRHVKRVFNRARWYATGLPKSRFGIKTKHIDCGIAGRGLGVVRIRALDALVVVAHAIAVAILQIIQVRNRERPVQVDRRLHGHMFAAARPAISYHEKPQLNVDGIRQKFVRDRFEIHANVVGRRPQIVVGTQ